MNAWLHDDAGIAMLAIFAGLGLLGLLIAIVIERRVRPQHERDFPHMATINRAREQRRRDHADDGHRERLRAASDLIIRECWQGPDAERIKTSR